jgi:hypothetical protein
VGAAVSALEQARLEKAREIAKEISSIPFLIEGATRSALAALTEANWQPPVDPDLLIAREAAADIACRAGYPESREKYAAGLRDNWSEVRSALAAIKLFKAQS